MSVERDPFVRFGAWFAEASRSEPSDPNAMTLATVGPDGQPSVRVVLLKAFENGGFTFYTNLESRKGREALGALKAALCFHWKSLKRQVRASGPVERVSDAEADAYFASRPRGSQIGAWASLQSQVLPSREALEARVREFEAKFPQKVPRPPHWSGLRVVPLEIEFWTEGAYRLHERHRYTRARADAPWTMETLFP
ncbi:MAG: pyridoxamine 5'-phosphate oxidase [Deltaproteobacteria bacterium]|nr:pyridoxamine 5'-phosphate oxidase [Deltaproteobacteria bacterium]